MFSGYKAITLNMPAVCFVYIKRMYLKQKLGKCKVQVFLIKPMAQLVRVVIVTVTISSQHC